MLNCHQFLLLPNTTCFSRIGVCTFLLILVSFPADCTISATQYIQVGVDDEALATVSNERLVTLSQSAAASITSASSAAAPLTMTDCAGLCNSQASCSAFSYQKGPLNVTTGDGFSISGSYTCRLGTSAGLRVAATGSKTYAKIEDGILADGSCFSSRQCSDGPIMTCSNSKCVCPPLTHVASINKSLCLPWSSAAGPCLETGQCNSSALYCSGNTCVCVDSTMTFLGNGLPCIPMTIAQLNAGAQGTTLKYPTTGDYGNNLDLWWCIFSQSGTTIQATVVGDWKFEFDYDYIEIYDGCTASQVLLASYMSAAPVAGSSTSSSLNHMAVHFVTEGSNIEPPYTYTGFSMNFTVSALTGRR